MISCCNFTSYLIDKHKIIIENTPKKCANVCNKRLQSKVNYFVPCFPWLKNKISISLTVIQNFSWMMIPIR